MGIILKGVKNTIVILMEDLEENEMELEYKNDTEVNSILYRNTYKMFK